ncbi:MAG: YihY/virulence factor BrkB family protein [Actinomycetota bacterium]|nr:YihY/virulence factor BrkB family protein [Actinomycetota bacterium]
MGEFFSDLRSVLGHRALARVGRKVLDDDCPGLAGQLAYFTLLSLFPFLLFLVTLAGLVIDDPESVLRTLTERLQGVLPRDAVGLLADYIDRTLRSASSSVLLLGILATLWSGWAAADAMIKAINRAYELQETRPWWRLWGISVLMILGFVLVIATLAFVVFGPEVGGYVQRLTGLPDAFLALWGILRWVLAFLAVTLAHDLLYYLAPNARIPFKWITPGGFAATALILVSSAALNLYVVNFARYNQIYGQVGAIIVLMVWLYSTGLMVLIGAEINAVLVRMAEERKNTELVQAESPAN